MCHAEGSRRLWLAARRPLRPLGGGRWAVGGGSVGGGSVGGGSVGGGQTFDPRRWVVD